MDYETVTIYTGPNCQKCTATKRYLDKHNIPYSTIDTSTPEGETQARATGFSRLPIVTTPVGVWDDHRVTMLDALRAALAGSQ